MKNLPATVLSVCLLAATTLLAAPAKRPDLQDVQQAISATQQQIKQTRTEQKAIDAAMSKTHDQLSRAEAELTRLTHQHSQAQQQLQRLQGQLASLKTKISGTQAQVARLLNAHYRNPQPNAVMLFLQNANAANKGRYLQYMRYLNRANEHVIVRLQQQQQQLVTQQAAADKQLKQLAALQRQQQKILSGLSKQQQQQHSQRLTLSKQMNTQNRQLAELRNDEKRLNRLVQRLAVQAAAKRKAEAQARQQAAQARAQAKAAAQAPSTSISTLTAEDMALRAPVEAAAEAHQPSGFSRLQGQMRRPVSGNITGQFGQTRPDGGTWKGLFITTAPAGVQSIAAGNVVYAADLQGYGNTVIVDHGDGYLSIYTGLSSIGVAAGRHVAARQTLGRSGRLPGGESGLYFEIRYHNQAMNPLSWLG